MRLDDVQLLKLLPRFMRDDRVARALCAAIRPALDRLAESVRKMDQYDYANMPEDLLDELAWQRNVLWYDKAAAPHVKRALVASAMEIYRLMGTKAAVERAIADYFGDAEMQEWFQYDGDPYHFRILTANPEAAARNGEKLKWILGIVKRATAVLDGIFVVTPGTLELGVGGIVQEYERIVLCEG